MYGQKPYNNYGMQRSVSTARKPKTRVYRFDARLNEEQKLLIQKAADLQGRTLTDFVLQSAQAAAERTIAERASQPR